MDIARNSDLESTFAAEPEELPVNLPTPSAAGIRLSLKGICVSEAGRIRVRVEDVPKIAAVVRAGIELFLRHEFRLEEIEFADGAVVLITGASRQARLFEGPDGAAQIAAAIAEIVRHRTEELVAAAAVAADGDSAQQQTSGSSSEENPSGSDGCPTATGKFAEAKSPPDADPKPSRESEAKTATDDFLATVVRHGIDIEVDSAGESKKVDLPARNQLPRVAAPPRLAPLNFRVECLMPSGDIAIDDQRRQLVLDGFELRVGDQLRGDFLVGATVSSRVFRLAPDAQYVLKRDGETRSVQANTDMFHENASTAGSQGSGPQT